MKDFISASFVKDIPFENVAGDGGRFFVSK
jgi:hypothetical protein